jgi:hypothetical protein
MLDGKWFDYVAQSMSHALVAALAVEALLQMWRARAPDDRLAARLLGLGQPLLLTPALFLLAPQRGAEVFHDRWAVFTARHWEDVAFQEEDVFIKQLGRARDRVGAHRLMFGSDHFSGPKFRGREQLVDWTEWFRRLPDAARKYAVTFTPEEIELILGGNAARCLGLDGR